MGISEATPAHPVRNRRTLLLKVETPQPSRSFSSVGHWRPWRRTEASAEASSSRRGRAGLGRTDPRHDRCGGAVACFAAWRTPFSSCVAGPFLGVQGTTPSTNCSKPSCPPSTRGDVLPEADDGLRRLGSVGCSATRRSGVSPARLVRRAVDEFEAGAVEAVVLVLNGASMGTRWLRPLLRSGALVCVHTPRVKYVDRWGVEQKRPTFWRATAYSDRTRTCTAARSLTAARSCARSARR